MDKITRRSLIINRWKQRSRFIASTVALAAMSIDMAEDSVIGNSDSKRRISQTVKERGTDDSILDTDKIEATVSRLEFDSETEGQGWTGGTSGGLLTKAERAQLARELAPIKAFRADVRALPLRLMA